MSMKSSGSVATLHHSAYKMTTTTRPQSRLSSTDKKLYSSSTSSYSYTPSPSLYTPSRSSSTSSRSSLDSLDASRRYTRDYTPFSLSLKTTDFDRYAGSSLRRYQSSSSASTLSPVRRYGSTSTSTSSSSLSPVKSTPTTISTSVTSSEVTEELPRPSVNELRQFYDSGVNNLNNPAVATNLPRTPPSHSELSDNEEEEDDDDKEEENVEEEEEIAKRNEERIMERDATRSTSEKGGLNGLRNIGNTCFMNSVIQCLSNTKPLLDYLVNDEYMGDINTTVSSMKGALIKAFASVVQELWASGSEDRVVNTSAFKNQIQRFAPRFMGYAQQDAQEFLRYLLEGLHEDVNRVQIKPKPITTDIDDSLSDNQIANEAWKRYLRMDDSKVMDIFVGQLKSTLQCTVCNHASVTFDPFWDLSLPLPSRVGSLKLQACLDMFAKEEVLDGDEKPTCSKCKTRRKCTKKFSIQKFPRILVLHLKRFSPTERFRGKLSNTVEFPLTGLDLSAYAACKGQSCSYTLYAISNHSGTTYSGHYTAYCRHPLSKTWHEYNDSRVSPISSRSIVSGEAYVLFYELSSQTSHL